MALLDSILKIISVEMALVAGCFGLENPKPDSLEKLLRSAMENQFRGSYSAEVVMVRESFLRGTDSMRGRLEFDDATGRRRVNLQGRDVAFEWWSRNFGQEQWWKDDNSSRLHRIPFRSLKKPAFGSLLSFEDLLKFPSDYLLDFKSCLKFSETDTSCQMLFSIRPDSRSRYASTEIVLSKKPVLLKRADFYGYDGRKLKSLEVSSYVREGEKFFPAGVRVFDMDSLASVRFSLLRPKSIVSPGLDKTGVADGRSLMRSTELGLEPDEEDAGEGEAELDSGDVAE